MSIERLDLTRHGELSAVVATGSNLHPAWSPRERLALATLSPRQWSRLGSLVFGGSARILRSPIGPALLAAILARASALTARCCGAASRRS
jgi:hypothetical protein